MITKLAAEWALMPQPSESRTSANPGQVSPEASDNQVNERSDRSSSKSSDETWEEVHEGAFDEHWEQI